MLVLTRKIDERIQIGDAIEVVVLSVQGSRVRLGIQAPREISVARTEANRFSDEHSLECELELAGCAH